MSLAVRTIVLMSGVAVATAGASLSGCDKPAEPAPTKTAAKPQAPSKPDAHDHGSADKHDHGTADKHDHDHADDHDHDHDHGPATALGEQSVGGFGIKVSRDGGVTPGSDAPIDAQVTGGSAKVAAVRFWIGTEDAKGSVKAKAELEKDNWHTHVEVPKPLPDGSKLWIEIETEKGERVVAGFDLKM